MGGGPSLGAEGPAGGATMPSFFHRQLFLESYQALKRGGGACGGAQRHVVVVAEDGESGR